MKNIITETNNNKKRTLYVLLAVFLSGTLILAGCQNATEAPAQKTGVPGGANPGQPVSIETSPQGTGMLPTVDPFSLSGDIIIAGSSTVYPLAERMASRFEDEGFSGNITIDSIGSGGGFERFCVNGETDISNASRPINNEELANCKAIGRDPIEFRIGTDALSVVVSSQNDFITNVTTDELALIFGAAKNWSDIRSEWPNEPIQRFIPGTDSGTFDYFVEKIFAGDQTPILSAANTQLSEDDNVLVQGVEGSPYAIGFFGYAYYINNKSALKALTVNGVEPDKENVDNFTYPLARPLFMYSTAAILKEKPQVAAFLNFVLNHVDEEIGSVGYFAAPDDALDSARQAWLTAVGQ